jgi:mRNA interferase RelE/StbE
VKYAILIDPQAMEDLRGVRAFDRRKLLDWIESTLANQPTRVGKSRIKRLRGLDSPQYRLRVDEFRVFYDVQADEVYVLRILSKKMVNHYLKEMGYEPETD